LKEILGILNILEPLILMDYTILSTMAIPTI